MNLLRSIQFAVALSSAVQLAHSVRAESAAAVPPALSGAGEREGLVILSTGEQLEGVISLARQRLLGFKEEKSGTVFEWSFQQIRRIILDPKETVLEEWRWREDGAEEKVPTGLYYRHVDFRAAVVTETGEQFVGHWTVGTPILIRSGRDVRRFLLYNDIKDLDHKSEHREALPPFVYVREIRFLPVEAEK